jgi:hypothetical protein
MIAIVARRRTIPNHCVDARFVPKATKFTPTAVSGKASSARVAAEAGVWRRPR